MDLPGPTASVGTRTDYLVGPWDYSACATQHLMAWGARTMVEKYSDRKLYVDVNSCIEIRLDLQADKSPVVVKGPFFPRVVNPRYRIRGTNV
jgi:hypothetical protein